MRFSLMSRVFHHRHEQEGVNEDQQDAEDHAELFRDGGEDHVCRIDRDIGRHSLIQSGPEPAAAYDREKGMRDLIAAAADIAPGVQPGIDAHPDMPEQLIGHEQANDRDDKALPEPQFTIQIFIGHKPEYDPENQNTAQILLQKQR